MLLFRDSEEEHIFRNKLPPESWKQRLQKRVYDQTEHKVIAEHPIMYEAYG
jgi:hypothetical protein